MRRTFSFLRGLAFGACSLLPNLAYAWTETTVLSDAITVAVARTGDALVEHVIVLRVRGTPPRSFDLPGVDEDAVPTGESTLASAKGGEDAEPTPTTPLEATVQPGGTLRLTAAGAKGLGHGTFRVRTHYRTDLRSGHRLVRENGAINVRWAGPKWPNGVDNVSCTWRFASAPEAPRAAGEALVGAENDDPNGPVIQSGAGAFLTTLRRQATGDELELMRPHVARGEQVTWTVRVDPKALSEVNDPRLHPSPASHLRAAVRGSAEERRVVLSVGTGLFFLFWALASIKQRHVLQAAPAGVVVPPLVPCPDRWRTPVAGLLVAFGVGLQLWRDSALIGSVVLLGAMAFLTYRTPRFRPVARGPGTWLPLSDDEAFRRVPARAADTFLDGRTWAGRGALLFVALAVAGVTWAARQAAPYYGLLTALDGLVFLPLFLTGCRGELPPDLATTPARSLRALALTLRRRNPTWRIVGWARFPADQTSPDELRLLVMPKHSPPGLTAIEVGCGYRRGLGGPMELPEILVRVVAGSEGEMRLRQSLGQGRWSDGRKAGERVLTLTPELPGRSHVVTLVSAVTQQLQGSTTKKARSLPSARSPNSSKRAARSGGSGEQTVKGATKVSPFQATDSAWSA